LMQNIPSLRYEVCIRHLDLMTAELIARQGIYAKKI
jgi:hypothetical protein